MLEVLMGKSAVSRSKLISQCSQKASPCRPPYSGRLLSNIYLAAMICTTQSEERNLLCVRAHNAEGPSVPNKASACSSGNDSTSFPSRICSCLTPNLCILIYVMYYCISATRGFLFVLRPVSE